MKKLICLLLSICLIVVSASSIYAASKEKEVVFNVRIFDSQEELIAYINSFETSGTKQSQATGKGILSTTLEVLIVRNGLTTNYCELYFHWYGNDIYSAFRFKKIVIKSTSVLNPVTYATIGDGVNYTTVYPSPAATSGYVYVEHIYIDGNITTVKVKSTSLQGYKNSTASWLSFDVSGSITIL